MKPTPLEKIEMILQDQFHPVELKVEDVSFRHAGHAGNPNRRFGGTHYEVTIASSLFQNRSLLDQHRMVYAALKPVMEEEKVHALQLKTKSVTEK